MKFYRKLQLHEAIVKTTQSCSGSFCKVGVADPVRSSQLYPHTTWNQARLKARPNRARPPSQSSTPYRAWPSSKSAAMP